MSEVTQLLNAIDAGDDAEGHLGIVNLATHELHTLNGEHEGRMTWLSLSSDGQRLATASIGRPAGV